MHQQSVSDLESQIISQNADGWVQVVCRPSTKSS
jgi:hypothetical protein